ncbi:L-aminopeptidase/D-esterase [Corynebacterium kutscheri]|uniref:L-aminopeptidase/D-esterase n=1 Tax=Corynebacterium kutscheri TaxID=35755 RepID=A0A0F6TDF3_9CORY|nr:P1 family peptidase [Corynebacterium kutscheri]AKE40836.1 L-aminopeptidase/D-esterase [Corynebacterium kutscheri]VEH09133.1 L-aminopeptidase/D-esterase [Corynebacterium kutscheri]VEH82471.1 L-aminopeptidase/D-esterase [Corynebacterium kutscheri]
MTSELFDARQGISAVPGITIGHTSLGDTGCTVVLTKESAIAAVDVRGGGPGTRETDLLAPYNTVERVHAVLLSGGSAYGLAAADGVMQALEEAGVGFPVLGKDKPGPIVPIVPGAVIFDLLVGDPTHRPGAVDGYNATQAALIAGHKQEEKEASKSLFNASTSIGAGCAATAGVLRGGCGQYAMQVGQYVIAAVVIANPVGNVVDPDTGRLWADPHYGVDLAKFMSLTALPTKLNTTIGVIVTNAPVTKSQAKRLAMVGHDGIAIAVRPAHSPLDGDTLFCLSTGDGTGVDIPTMQALSAAAAQVVARGIIAAVIGAEPGLGLTAFSEIELLGS